MTNFIKKFIWAFSLLPLFFASPAFAAAPDGAGPWADAVVTTAQGLRNDGSAVPAVRSNPTAALGVAEQTNADGTFYSLGFGGSITLGFVNGISGGSMVFESTNLPYPIETAKVEFSSNGTTWVNAGSVSRSGTVNQPREVKCAKFVRITDTSDKSLFEPTADGYDVDGVKALGNNCNPSDNHCEKCDCDQNITVNSFNKDTQDKDHKKCCDDKSPKTDNVTNRGGSNNHDSNDCDKENHKEIHKEDCNKHS